MNLSKSQSRGSAASVEEEALMKQGIVAILDSNGGERVARAASIRRTLSADMSSKKWLEQNGMKKVVSSMELVKLPVSDSSSSSSSSEIEDDFEKFRRQDDDVWRSSVEKPAPPLADVWSSIMMCQKKNDDSPLPPPYVHPLVKRSSSALSEKSLEICTESLGSETGSDCFSAYCSSDEGKDGEIRVSEDELKEENQYGDFLCGAALMSKKSPAARPSPPPIHSISGGCGASIHMNWHRENGRLVVEAVSVPPRNFFQAQRRDGRLVLSLVRSPPAAAEMADESDGVSEFENSAEETLEKEETATGGGGYAAEEEVQSLTSLHNSGVMMSKFMAIGNRTSKADNPPPAEDEAEELPVAQSLPPRPPVSRLIRSPPTAAAAASFNAYEYFWRNTNAAACGGGGGGYMIPINKRRHNDSVTIDGVKDGQSKAEYIGPYFRGCKDGRRSLLIWEPYYCIAT